MKKIEHIRKLLEEDKTNLDICAETGASINTVRTQRSKWKKEKKEDKQ